MRLHTCWPGIAAVAMLIVGCSREIPRETVYPVHGKVLLNGSPVCMGILELKPTTPGKGMVASAVINASGEFDLSTYSNTEPDGAVPGEYKVVIKSHNVNEGGILPEGVTPTKVPSRYGSPETSDLVIEITEDNGEVTLNLQE